MGTEGFARRAGAHAMERLPLGIPAPKQRVRKGEVIVGVMDDQARSFFAATIRSARCVNGKMSRAMVDGMVDTLTRYLRRAFPALRGYKDAAVRRGWTVVGIGKKMKKRR